MIFLVKREIRMKRIMAGVAIMFVSFGVIGGAPCQADVRDRPVIWAYWGHEPSEFLQRKGGMPGMFSLGEWMPKCSLVSAERKEGCVTLRVRGLRTMASVIFRKKGKSR